MGQQFIPPLRTDDAWCARRSSEDLGGPIGGGILLFSSPDRVVSPPAASLTAPLCRYVPLGRAGDRSFKMKSKERHALLARYAARFNRPRDEAPKAGGDCGCD